MVDSWQMLNKKELQYKMIWKPSDTAKMLVIIILWMLEYLGNNKNQAALSPEKAYHRLIWYCSKASSKPRQMPSGMNPTSHLQMVPVIPGI